MPLRSSRRRTALAVSLAIVAVALTALHSRYPLPYVYRCFRYQDADFEDIHRFPARSIAGAALPSRLIDAPSARLASLLEEHEEIDDFQAFLDATETTAFVVQHRGELIAEHYRLGHDRTSLQNTFSVSKSLASALVGLAIDRGALALQDSIVATLPELARRDERFGAIQVEHLLDMRSGIRYSSGASFPFINADDALVYYFPDLESLVLGRTTVASAPGEFQYNHYNPPLLGLVLRRATGMPVGEFLERELWQPMGAEAGAGWTVDDHGVEQMDAGFHARARDLARFGQLYLDGGAVSGRRVLPEAWVGFSTELPERFELERYDGRSWAYRLGWWIVPRPEGPSDFAAIGRYGQFVYVSPQHEAVFVRNGPGRGDWGDRDWTELFYSLAGRLDS